MMNKDQEKENAPLNPGPVQTEITLAAIVGGEREEAGYEASPAYSPGCLIFSPLNLTVLIR